MYFQTTPKPQTSSTLWTKGKRIDDLSEELNLKPNAIYQLRHRAHLALKDCMHQEPPLPQA